MHEIKMANSVVTDTTATMIRVLRFFREFLHISTRDLASSMAGGSRTRSMIAAVEVGSRKPSEDFIKDYAAALQKRAKLEKDRSILEIAQKCIGDAELLTLMEEYERKEGGFKIIYNISSRISELANKA